MIFLTSTSHSLVLNNGGGTGLYFSVSYVDIDITNNTITPASAVNSSASVGDATMVAAPSAGVTRQIKYLSIYNNDASASNTVKVIKDTGSQYVISKYTLAAGATLEYTESAGFQISPQVSGGGISDGDKGDITVSASGATWTIDNLAVSYAKIQNVSATARILGRNTAGAGSIEELTAATTKTMLSLDLVENTALSTWAGTTNITTLGTIATGVWQGTAHGVLYGGTGQTSYTDGQLLIGNTTGNTLTKATLTAGTGISITNGAGSITVSSSSALVYISSATASASSSISFTGLTTVYSSYLIEFTKVVPATNTVELWVRTSTNNGVSYDSGASDYNHGRTGVDYSGPASAGSAADSKVILTGGADNGAGHFCNGVIKIFRPTSATYGNIMFDNTVSTSATHYRFIGIGMRLTSADIDAVQILFSSGNIASGEFRLYGVRDA
jgi:hypothetical protein